MPHEITLHEVPAGYALSPGRPGDTVKVAVREFLSSEDGDQFVRRLEGFPNIILSQIPAEQRPKPSQVDHLLVIIRRDKTATIYINELRVLAEMLAKRNFAAGDPVFDDDIADIRALKFDGIEVPDEAGVLYLFSSGWRKGLFYDFGPVAAPDSPSRDFDLSASLAGYFTYLIYQDRLKIAEEVWETLLRQAWFPFISLRTSLVQDLVNYAKNGWNIDELVPKVSHEIRQASDKLKEKWAKNPLLVDHSDVLNVALERFMAGDFISAVSILYPRIEGVMRTYHLDVRPSVSQTQRALVETAVNAGDVRRQPGLLLLPEKFRQYLADVYFCAFDPKKPEGVSRNTVAHGVAPQDAFSEKAAVIGFLILDQLSYYFAAHQTGSNSSSSGREEA